MVGVTETELIGADRRPATEMYDEPASVNDMIFPAGSVVKGTTILGQTLHGQVVGFDQERKMLVLRDSTGPRPIMRFVNLDMVNQDLVIVGERRASDFVPYTSGKYTEHQLTDRLKKAIQKRDSSALACDIPTEGQRAFIALRKTLDQVEWDNEKINVFDGKISVGPPYTADSVKLLQDNTENNRRAVEQIQRILSKPLVPTPLSAFLSLKCNETETPIDPVHSKGI